jgi:hypothetical protein
MSARSAAQTLERTCCDIPRELVRRIILADDVSRHSPRTLFLPGTATEAS